MFTPIDPTTWKRASMFYYFARMAPTGYSVTVEVDVTNVYDTVKREGYKFFPAYLWLVTRNLNRQTEFKCAVVENTLGYYDTLTPLYAHWHEDDKTFSLMWTEFHEDFKVFHEAYLENQKTYGDNHGVLSQSEVVPPPNAYTVSALPWISFDHFAVHSYEKKDYFFPSVEAGKMREKEGRRFLPLSLTCHHAATDGYHLHVFLENLKKDIEEFENLI